MSQILQALSERTDICGVCVLCRRWTSIAVKKITFISQLLNYLVLNYMVLNYMVLNYMVLNYMVLNYLVLNYMVLNYNRIEKDECEAPPTKWLWPHS
jgi:hypothetical protein